MMKNILTLSVLAFACGTALAQSESSVTLYGVADGGVTRVTGLKAGTDNRVVSGIMDGSRWGLRGNEVIGNGYRGLFVLESRLELNNGSISNRPPSGSQVPDRIGLAPLLFQSLTPAQRGTLAFLGANQQVIVTNVSAILGSRIGVNLGESGGPPNYWDRQAYVGLVTPVGGILIGRQYTPAYEVSALFDTLGTQSPLAAGQVAAFPPSIDIRANNALQYRFEKGAFSGGVMYTVETSPSQKTLKGLSVMYKTDALSFGLGYNTRKNELGKKSLTSAILGASVRIGPGHLTGQVGSAKDDNPSDLSTISALLQAPPNNVPNTVATPFADLIQTAFINALKQDARLAHIGYKLVAGSSTVYVAYSLYNDKRPANADTASFGAVYSYGLSKRTDVNLALVRFNNKGLGQAAPGATGYIGGVTATAGTDSNSFALGLRHRF